jgi:preprotein translocase subunit SecE
VARDRQRAKQRKARRAQQRGPRPSQPRRADLPGELEHASGEVDEFEAALVSGADGQTVDDEPDVRDEADADEDLHDDRSARDDAFDDDASALVTRSEGDDERSALLGSADDDDVDDDERSAVAELEEEEDEVDDATLEREAVGATPAARREAAPGVPTRKGGGRFVSFLRASWAELQRVQWPDRRQVAQATGVVIGFVIVAGLYLGVADWVAKQIVNAII